MRIALAAVFAALFLTAGVLGQTTVALPRVELLTVPLMKLPGSVDSNSPVVWEWIGGQPMIFVVTSAGSPKTAAGRRLEP